MVLIVPPKSEMVRMPASSESGMASAEMAVVRTLPRNRNRMISTRIAPSRRAAVTFSIATSMKSAWRKFSFSMVTPSGRLRASRASAWSIWRVRASVLAPGCFWTLRMTAGLRLVGGGSTLGLGADAERCRGRPTVIGTPPSTRTTAEARS